MTRKLLFLVFSADTCRLNHALLHALDLEDHGHRVRIILEGEATRRLRDRQGRFAELFQQARDRDLIVGVCATAARGCSTGDELRDVAGQAERDGLPLLSDLSGHASIEAYLSEGFELVTF